MEEEDRKKIEEEKIEGSAVESGAVDEGSQEHDHPEDEECNCHGPGPAQMGNPLANLDSETQAKIQELQGLEQNFQQLMMQKNSYAMEKNEADLVISELEKTNEEVFRIVGNSVVIKSSKDEILEDMHRKKELVEKRLEGIEAQEKDFSDKIEEIRNDVLSKIQG